MENGKRTLETATASSSAAQKETTAQEVGEPLQKKNKGIQAEASHCEEEEVLESDYTDSYSDSDSDSGTETDTEGEEAALAAAAAAMRRGGGGLVAKLGHGGIILVLVETYTGFAIFGYDGLNLLIKDAYQNLWVHFGKHTTFGERPALLLELRAFEDKASAINPNGISDELAAMIRKHIKPGQKLAVENEDFKRVIQNSMGISCLYDETVEELMWGLNVQMAYLVPAEKSKLDEEDRFPMSKAMEQFMNQYGFILEPDLRVTRQIMNLASVVHESDRSVNKHADFLRSASQHIMRISRVDTREWDLMKLAIALKLICCPEEKIAAPPMLFSKRLLEKLKKDAPKYERKILKSPTLIMHNQMYHARRARSNALKQLSRLLEQNKMIEEVIVQLTGCNESLQDESSKRQNPSTQAPADVLERYTCTSSHQLHRTNEPGILSMCIHPSKDVVATGGIDTNAVLFDRQSDQILCTLTGHSKKITTSEFVNGDELFITGSADKTVRIWRGSEHGNYSCIHTLKDHTHEVAAVTVHANEKYFVSASKDNSWCLYDIFTGFCLSKVGEASEPYGYTSASFHPRGLLLGTGTAARVKLWDMKTPSHIANLKGHVGPVTSMSFSENGYLLATAARDGVRLWDVRKLTNRRTISPYDSGTPTNAVEFDSSGSYLGIGGSDARVYQADKAEWNIIKTLPDLSGTGKVTSLKFGADAKYIAVGSMDGNLRIFGLPGDEQMDV